MVLKIGVAWPLVKPVNAAASPPVETFMGKMAIDSQSSELEAESAPA